MPWYIDAQKDYAAEGHDGFPAGIYAQRLMSSSGKQDGLYWEIEVNRLVPPARSWPKPEDRATKAKDWVEKASPYHGYLHRILKAQGAAAKGGAKNYLSDGNLTSGVAMVAYPAEYKVSGVMTFIINQDGVVYEKDLGEKTAETARAMTEYNPDSTWHKVAN